MPICAFFRTRIRGRVEKFLLQRVSKMNQSCETAFLKFSCVPKLRARARARTHTRAIKNVSISSSMSVLDIAYELVNCYARNSISCIQGISNLPARIAYMIWHKKYAPCRGLRFALNALSFSYENKDHLEQFAIPFEIKFHFTRSIARKATRAVKITI